MAAIYYITRNQTSAGCKKKKTKAKTNIESHPRSIQPGLSLSLRLIRNKLSLEIKSYLYNIYYLHHFFMYNNGRKPVLYI